MTQALPLGDLHINNQKIQDRIENLIAKLIENYMSRYPNQSGSNYTHAIDYQVETGKKYYKIMMVDHPRTPNEGRSVHAFIDKQTGAVYKPASWRGPAKIARYNLLDDISYERCIQNADWCGSYLYIR